MIISESMSPIYEAFTFYVPLFLCCMSIVGGFFVIRTHSKFIRMQLYSGKLFLHVTIIQLLISLIFGLSLFYKSTEQENDNGYDNQLHPTFIIDDLFSIIIGAIEVHISLCYFLYHFFISHNLSYSTNRYNSHSFKKRHLFYVVYTQLISFALALLAVVTKQISLQDIGVFGIGMKSPMQFIYLFVLAILVPYSIYSICRSRIFNHRLDHEANLFEDDYEREIRHDFVDTNSLYLIMFIITWSPYAAVSYFGYTNSDNCACIDQQSCQMTAISKMASLNLVCSSAFFGAMIKITRPIIKREMKSIFQRRGSGGLIRMLLHKDDSRIEDEEENVDDKRVSLLHHRTGSFDIESSPNPRSTSMDEALMFEKIPFAMDAYAKKKVPLKKPVTPADHLDIVLGLIKIIQTKSFSDNVQDYPPTPWTKHQYNYCKNEEIDTNNSFTVSERVFLLERLKKAITLHKVNYIQHAEEVFNHLFVVWDLTKRVLERTFDFNENVEFFANIHRKPFSHLEKRYFHVTPNKKILLEIIEKESKIYFLDSFLPAYHHYMATNRASFIVKILGLCTFNIGKNTHNVMTILNNYEKFYKDQNREGVNIGIPSCIVERYLIDGKNFRHEVYNKGVLERKQKTSHSEKNHKKIFFLSNEIKDEIMDQLKIDLEFLNKYDVINYRVVLLVTKDERRKKSLFSARPKPSDTKHRYLVDGSTALPDGSALKIFIDTNLVTSGMKAKKMKKTKNQSIFSLDDCSIYRQCIEEVVNNIL